MPYSLPGSLRERRHPLALILALTLLTISACEGPQTIDPPIAPPTETQQADDVSALLRQAADSPSPMREQLQLDAAQLLFKQGKEEQAHQVMKRIRTTGLPPELLGEYTLLLSYWMVEKEDFAAAIALLDEPEMTSLLPQLSPPLAMHINQLKADLYAVTGEHEKSLRLKIAITAALSDQEQIQRNHRAIWQSLMQLPPEHLQLLAADSDFRVQGWAQLAQLGRENLADLDLQLQQLKNWEINWAQHPAASQLPQELQILQQLALERPQKIALLLPGKGKLQKAAQAIRDGFMAAYYQSLSHGSRVPSIEFFDTTEADLTTLYSQLQQQGFQLAIGPLDKQRVQELELHPSLPIPTLTLNYGHTSSFAAPAGLYQFGLAATDEAKQAAARAWQEGRRNALILTPQSDWGERVITAFSNQWQELGGNVAAIEQFSDKDNFSQTVRHLVGVDLSDSRAKQLRRIIGKGVEYNPRRRRDIDMIFLVATPKQARQLKPMFAFHYAGDLPVYATSHIYAGKADPERDRDLNGIRFNAIPWLFDQNSEIKATANLNRQSHSGLYQRLYALGIDSYRLHPRLSQMEAQPDTTIYGSTGALRMTTDGAITREQVWAEIRNGIARQLPNLSNDTNVQKSL